MKATLKGPESNMILLQPGPPVEQKTEEPLLVTVNVAISPVVALVIVTSVLS